MKAESLELMDPLQAHCNVIKLGFGTVETVQIWRNSSQGNLERWLYFPQVCVQKVSGQHSLVPRQPVAGIHHLLRRAERGRSGQSFTPAGQDQRAEVQQQHRHTRCALSQSYMSFSEGGHVVAITSQTRRAFVFATALNISADVREAASVIIQVETQTHKRLSKGGLSFSDVDVNYLSAAGLQTASLFSRVFLGLNL